MQAIRNIPSFNVTWRSDHDRSCTLMLRIAMNCLLHKVLRGHNQSCQVRAHKLVAGDPNRLGMTTWNCHCDMGFSHDSHWVGEKIWRNPPGFDHQLVGFRWANSAPGVTKMFTAAAVMKMVAAGRFRAWVEQQCEATDGWDDGQLGASPKNTEQQAALVDQRSFGRGCDGPS